jgi:hypothetical protein
MLNIPFELAKAYLCKGKILIQNGKKGAQFIKQTRANNRRK